MGTSWHTQRHARTHRAQRGLCLSNGQNNTHHEYSSTCFLPETTHYLALQFTKPDANWMFACLYVRVWKGTSKPAQRRAEIEFWRENQSRDDLKLIASTLAPTLVTASPPFPPLSSPSSLVLLNQVWQTSCFTLSLSNLNTGPYLLSVLARTGPISMEPEGFIEIFCPDNSKPARSCQLSLLVRSDSNQQQTIQLQGFYRMSFLRCQLFSCAAKSATWRTASLSQSILSTPAPCIHLRSKLRNDCLNA